MVSCQNLLIVGGTGRNVGKTELLCRILSMISTDHDVFAVKISEIFPDDISPATLLADCPDNYSIHEETRDDVSKDTSRMLKAGAHRVFYLRSEDTALKAAFCRLLSIVPENSPIVCESNNLISHISPGLFIVVTTAEHREPTASDKRFQDADDIFISSGKAGFPQVKRIKFIDNSWQIDEPG